MMGVCVKTNSMGSPPPLLLSRHYISSRGGQADCALTLGWFPIRHQEKWHTQSSCISEPGFEVIGAEWIS